MTTMSPSKFIFLNPKRRRHSADSIFNEDFILQQTTALEKYSFRNRFDDYDDGDGKNGYGDDDYDDYDEGDIQEYTRQLDIVTNTFRACKKQGQKNLSLYDTEQENAMSVRRWSLPIPSVAYQVDSMYAADFSFRDYDNDDDDDEYSSFVSRRNRHCNYCHLSRKDPLGSSCYCQYRYNQKYGPQHRRRRLPCVHLVRWTFGFANRDALSRGESGAACLGEEHEIILEWTISTGVTVVYFDSIRVVQQQQQRRQHRRRLAVCFDLPRDISTGHHIVHIFGRHKSSVLGSWNAKFDMRINGQSFVKMVKVDQLGMYNMIP